MAYVYNAPKFATKNNYAFYPEKLLLLNGGLNLVDLEEKLKDNQTSNAKNVWFKDGELDKRFGQDHLDATEVVDGVCHSAYKGIYKGFIIKHCGTKLYKQNKTTGALTTIFTGLVDADSELFKYNENIYLKQPGKYVQWDGTTATDVIAYIPTVIINRTPTGGGDLNEGYNRLGKGFRNSFNGTGAAVAFTLTDQNLDATLVTATVGGVAKVEGIDFTVNRVTGVVTFGVAPALGTNNVVITAYKTVQDDIDSILDCLSIIPFGGQNDNRLFFGNNGTGFYFWTGISSVGVDPTYFPYDNYNIVGMSDENIFGFGKQYGTLVVLKEKELFGVDYTFDGTKGVFNSYPINNQIGCDCPNTIQTVNNNLVWLSTTFGPCILLGTNVGNQRNAFSIGRNINPRLKGMADKTKASSTDYDGKYWLCVGSEVFVWDYFISPYIDSYNPDQAAENLSWWYFTNISAKDFIIDGLELYYVERSGKTVKFNTVYDIEQFYDFGLGIDSIYRYPKRELGGGIMEFSILKGFINVRGDRKSSHTVTYFTSDEPNGDPNTDSVDVGSFTWFPFSWALFTWQVMGPLYNWVLTPLLKNIRWFACEFANNEAGVGMNISSMQWQFQTTRMIR